MSLSAKLRRAPLRVATGAYILNTGITKLNADDDTAKSLHAMASGTYPVLGKLEPKVFMRSLAVGEIVVGTTLLLPIVPSFIAGATLTGFSSALLNMYWNTPGMHHEDSLRPTPQGTAISKDVWMLGIGLGLMTDAALEGTREGFEQIEASIAQRRVDAQQSRRARRLSRRDRRAQIAEAVKRPAQRASDASELTGKRLAEMSAGYGAKAADKGNKARETLRHAAKQYGPAAAQKMKAAGHAAQEYATQARERLAS